MTRRLLTAGALWTAMAAAPTLLHAQTATPAPATPAAEAPAAPAADAAAITAQIQRVQQQALQDPELRAANQAISTLLTATMAKVDPSYPTYAARVATLNADVAAAQAAKDNARLNELAAEAKELQASVAAAQAKAREDAAVKAELEAFRVKLFTKMVEIDPSVKDLVAQLETLQSDTAESEATQ
jgi:hypothetical protein